MAETMTLASLVQSQDLEPLERRFLSKLLERGECWEWQASTTSRPSLGQRIAQEPTVEIRGVSA